jgi:hypothetical protein
LRVLRTLGLTTVPPMVTWPSATSTTCTGGTQRGRAVGGRGRRHASSADQRAWATCCAQNP